MENKDSKNIYLGKNDINKLRSNSMVMRIKEFKRKFALWKKERIENANKIAFNITSKNQTVSDMLINIDKRKK